MTLILDSSNHLSIRKQRQLARNTGQSYISTNKKFVPERKFQRLNSCKKKCFENISLENQQNMFNSYWKQGTYAKRTEYIKSWITLRAVERSRRRLLNSGSQSKMGKRFSAVYHLSTGNHETVVCRSCFCKTLGETNSFIENVLNNMTKSETRSLETSSRGKHPPKNKTPNAKSNRQVPGV